MNLLEGVEDPPEGILNLRIVAGHLVEHCFDAVDVGHLRVRTDDTDLGHVESVSTFRLCAGPAL
ncbi:hypothetical protein C475_22139 [Halosimplex carlsbadense 2-9-1]|uniref:Uncharacterized protein n=1 Tax=Halosimplex carlsbadense 2-9-1 TaxID=797114 RepID=M0C8U7_9EURY|nr:hypothetical protein C475_22139 [Halosimplex carlsbadense 2-9-1]